jgi:hypothetical protein
VAVLRAQLEISAGIFCQQYWALVPPAAHSPVSNCTASPHTATACSTYPSMQLIQLADRDGLLLPGFSYATSDAGTDNDDPSRSPADGDCMQEIELYLDGSLIPSLGHPQPYRPGQHPGDTLNALVSGGLP